jgi:hypothetical protein
MMYGASTSTSTTTAREEGGGDTQAGIGEREYLYHYIQWKKNPKLEKLATIINIINVHFLS